MSKSKEDHNKEDHNMEDWESLEDLREYQANYLSVNRDEDNLICECKALLLSDLQDFIESNKISHFVEEDFRRITGLGSGCASCLKEQKTWLQRLKFFSDNV